jgi:hypothetical protein
MVIFGILTNPFVEFLVVVVATYLFLKFCSWAKRFTLSGGVKKIVYILTGIALVGFNILYSKGNTMVVSQGDWSGATLALLASLVWVLIFAFVLMAETKVEQ